MRNKLEPELLLAVPDLYKAFFVACNDKAALNQDITASEFVFMLIAFVHRELAKLLVWVIPQEHL